MPTSRELQVERDKVAVEALKKIREVEAKLDILIALATKGKK